MEHSGPFVNISAHFQLWQNHFGLTCQHSYPNTSIAASWCIFIYISDTKHWQVFQIKLGNRTDQAFPTWIEINQGWGLLFFWSTDSRWKLQSLVKAATPQLFIFHNFHETQQMLLNFTKQLSLNAQSPTEVSALITTKRYQKEKPQQQLCLPKSSPTSCSQIQLKKPLISYYSSGHFPASSVPWIREHRAQHQGHMTDSGSSSFQLSYWGRWWQAPPSSLPQAFSRKTNWVTTQLNLRLFEIHSPK